MTATILLYDPTAPARRAAIEAFALPRAPHGLAGRTVGFIDNAKPNFAHLVDDLADELVRRFGVAKVVKRQKRAASVPAEADLLHALAQECDLVVAGSGD